MLSHEQLLSFGSQKGPVQWSRATASQPQQWAGGVERPSKATRARKQARPSVTDSAFEYSRQHKRASDRDAEHSSSQEGKAAQRSGCEEGWVGPKHREASGSRQCLRVLTFTPKSQLNRQPQSKWSQNMPRLTLGGHSCSHRWVFLQYTWPGLQVCTYTPATLHSTNLLLTAGGGTIGNTPAFFFFCGVGRQVHIACGVGGGVCVCVERAERHTSSGRHGPANPLPSPPGRRCRR